MSRTKAVSSSAVLATAGAGAQVTAMAKISATATADRMRCFIKTTIGGIELVLSWRNHKQVPPLP